MCLTLGTYLRSRREAALLSIEDVAVRFSTEPRYAEHVRAELLRLIEADAVAPSFMTIVVIGAIYPIDMQVLIGLAAGEGRLALPAMCPGCSCSAGSPCIDQVRLVTCQRSGGDLCTHCQAGHGELLIATVRA